MSSKLAILIPHYKETEEEVKPLLDSIQSQININRDDFEVIIGNDGDEVLLTKEFLSQYKFRIQYHIFPHERLAGCRKNLFDISDSEYVMFCDSDDRFVNDIAFSIILTHMQDKPEGIIFDFFEEHMLPDGHALYVYHTDDPIFVHGKVWNSEFLRENEIEWDASLHEHQDSAFNVLARLLSKRLKIAKTPIYLWHDNPNSVSRKNREYHTPITWPHMIDSYDSLIGNLLKRGFGPQAAYYSKYCLFATYYEMSHDVYLKEDTSQYKINIYKRLAQFYDKYHLIIKRCTEEQTNKLIEVTKNVAEKKGHMNEMPPFEGWFAHILLLFAQ